jgi:hypothetical protein
MAKNTNHIPESQLLRINSPISSKLGKCLLSFPGLISRVADYVPDVWESLEPRYRHFRIDAVELIKLDSEGVDKLTISELSALGLMDPIGWIQAEWHSCKDNLRLANLLGQTNVSTSIQTIRTRWG